MKKYRIVKRTIHGTATYLGDELFYVQKRFLGFLWWIDRGNDGYLSEGSAADSIKFPDTEEVVGYY